jgi:tetratricopeptide (TPR) repeat protein
MGTSKDQTPVSLTLSREVMAAARSMYQSRPKNRLARCYLMDSIRWHANNLHCDGQYQQANRVYSELIEHCMKQPRLNEIRELINLKQFDRAKSKLELHLKSYATDMGALDLLAKLLRDLSKPKEALRLFQTMLKLAPGYLDVHFSILSVAYNAGSHDVVESSIAAIKQLSPESYDQIDISEATVQTINS